MNCRIEVKEESSLVSVILVLDIHIGLEDIHFVVDFCMLGPELVDGVLIKPSWSGCLRLL